MKGRSRHVTGTPVHAGDPDFFDQPYLSGVARPLCVAWAICVSPTAIEAQSSCCMAYDVSSKAL